MDKHIMRYVLSHRENLRALMTVEHWRASTEVQRKFLITF